MKKQQKKSEKQKPPVYMMNRELSWLKFNERVLNEAGNPRVPLAERLTFASIYQSNLDEFYRVRVGTLMDQMESSEVIRENKTNMTSEEQVRAIVKETRELDLKKAAREVGEKSLAMLHVKDINTVTGYVRGGCTAVGMKKQYVTRIDASAQNLPTMVVSGGHLGTQLELKPEDLRKAANAEFADIVVE